MTCFCKDNKQYVIFTIYLVKNNAFVLLRLTCCIA
nr:MAG TPA: hypothetical protein [Caudoviricetes sp.]